MTTLVIVSRSKLPSSFRKSKILKMDALRVINVPAENDDHGWQQFSLFNGGLDPKVIYAGEWGHEGPTKKPPAEHLCNIQAI